MNELQPQEYSNTCLDRGLLVSLRDGELTGEEIKKARAHLAICPDCAADERALATDSREMYDLLASLGPAPEEVPDGNQAFAAVQSRIAEVEPSSAAELTSPSAGTLLRFGSARKSNRKPVWHRGWWIAAAAAVMAALILLPPSNSLANQFLSLFQPHTFQPVSVNLTSFRNGLGEDLQYFGELNVNTRNLGSITHPTLAQIQQDLNFTLMLPGHLPPGVGPARQFTLVDSSEGTFTFNAAQARAYLDENGQGSVSIPPQLDGATFTITLAPGVIINFGKQCSAQTQSVNPSGSNSGRVSASQAAPGSSPAASSAGNGNGAGTSNGPTLGIAALGCTGGKPFYIAELPSPVVRATGKASLEDLRSFLLSLPRLSSGARLLLQDLNLTTGVVPLPIPPQVQAQQITTHGVQGVMMVDSSLTLGAVIWQTGGIVYALAGATSDSTQLMDSANSLH
jgi:hypothetical protein